MSHPPAEPIVEGLLSFVDASPTPYHAVAQATAMLERAGFVQLREIDPWTSLAPGTRAFSVRAGSSVCAFIVGKQAPHEAGFQLIGAHTDSPNLRVKPRADLRAHGFDQLAVEIYGGVLWHTWLDRDLSLAGRVVIDDGSAGGRTLLLDFARPLLRIPNLAIHLNRTVNTEGLKLNAQSHLAPIWGLAGPKERGSLLVETLADELRRGGHDVQPRQIVGWDLCLYDVQRASLAGLGREFILAPRLDNLASCYAALRGLTTASQDRAHTRAIVLYDHEEVGSESAQGAGSPFLLQVLARICGACGGGSEPDALARALGQSFMISADMAHAVHPNYADRHEPAHQPRLGGGPVLKTNASQSYASDAETSARFRLLCRSVEVEPQDFVTRSDLACGSTIGPITAARVGLRTVDVGNPLLSMHSIREMAAVADVGAMQKVVDAFFR